MFRVLAAFVLIRLLSQSGGFDLLVESHDTPCEESDSSDCSPECDDCLCCPHQRVMTLHTATDTLIADAGPTEFAAMAKPVQDGRAHEIFHIPKRSFSV